MERWEPPRVTEDSSPRRRRPVAERPRRDLPEVWLIIGVRLGICLVLMLAVLFEGLRAHMPVVALVLVVALVAVIAQTNQNQTQKLRKQSMLDLAMLITVVPIAALNAFVAAEPGELLPAERSTLLQTGGMLLIALALVIWLVGYLFPGDEAFMPAAILPGMLAVLSMTFILHDFRNQTVLAMLAVSYFVGAIAIALGTVVEEPVRRYLPATFYIATVLTGALLFDPGISNVFDRDGLIQMYTGLMMLIGAVVLIVIPNPTLDLSRLFAGAIGSSARGERTRNRSQNGFGRDLEERS